MASATGLYVFKDTGPPWRSTDYTTLVIIHGYAWYSPSFTPLLPLARDKRTNARIVLVTRRDYPAADPYTVGELALLPDSDAVARPPAADPDPDAREADRLSLAFFMKHRAHELLRLLTELVRTGTVPPADADRNAGGLVLVGWSFGVLWVQALLAHAASFWHDDVQLGRFLRRVVLYEGFSSMYGYPRPADAFNPFLDPAAGLSERSSEWLSGYYTHGPAPDALEHRNCDVRPPPTLRAMSAAHRDAVLCSEPAEAGGSDHLLALGAFHAGLYAELRAQAWALHPRRENDLRDVEVRVVWGDRSVWEVVHAAWAVKEELRAARAAARPMRNMTVARVRGGNHFAHWDCPEDVLRAFLAPWTELED
ncbi:hypothetical protein C8Q80DRAFT_1236436 [Daedaleopsis nitida]|nr:hypothetical protein C8Q80DRAFT_1236436 [Daedaleopsis nitida]